LGSGAEKLSARAALFSNSLSRKFLTVISVGIELLIDTNIVYVMTRNMSFPSNRFHDTNVQNHSCLRALQQWKSLLSNIVPLNYRAAHYGNK
jgi:hypothetical protein